MTPTAFDPSAPGTSDSVALLAPACLAAADIDIRNDAWFSRLYEDCVDSVYRYARSLTRSDSLAEDITADTFLRAWRARQSYRGEGAATSWLLTIARNCATTTLTRRKEEVDLALINDREDPTSCFTASADDSTDLIQKALLQLTQEQQQVIFLRFFRELPHEQVAAMLGRNPAAIRAIQFRALSRMRKLMETMP